MGSSVSVSYPRHFAWLPVYLNGGLSFAMATDLSTAFRPDAEVLDDAVPVVGVHHEQEWVDVNSYRRWFPRDAMCERARIQDYELKVMFRGIHRSAPRDNTIYICIFISGGPTDVSGDMGTNTPGWGWQPVPQAPLVPHSCISPTGKAGPCPHSMETNSTC